jgi:hypothetical protein
MFFLYSTRDSLDALYGVDYWFPPLEGKQVLLS